MVKGVSIVARMLQDNWRKPFLVKPDPDVDGLFAGLLIIDLLKHLNKKFKISLNENRSHGVLENMEDYKGYLIINTDSGVSKKRLKEIVNSGVSIISIDHHELEDDMEYSTNCLSKLTSTEKELVSEGLFYYCNSELGTEGVVINNQYGFEDPNYTFMSGCGVVLDVIKQLQPTMVRREHVAWHGITLLSDSREIETPQAREVLEQTYGINLEEAPTLRHLTNTIGFNKFEIGEDTIDRAYVDFYFSPYINAMLRWNLGNLAMKWFMGHDVPYVPVREKQKLVIEELKRRVVRVDLENTVLVNVHKKETDKFEVSNFIGLLANKMLVDGKTVTITCTTPDGKFERGSVRGYYPSVDYRTIFEQQGLVALGHKGAFGLKTYKTNPTFWKNLDKLVGEADKTREQTYKVHHIPSLPMNRTKIRELATENQFLRTSYKNYIKYTGMKAFPSIVKPNFQEYMVDGIPVKAFDSEVSVENGYILPTISKGYLSLYLERVVM